MTSPDFGAEAAGLLSAAERWLRAAGDGTATVHQGEPFCQVCPLCQLAALIRGVRPDVAQHLVEAAVSLASAFRAFTAAPPETAESDATPAEPAVVVQHITVN